MPSNCQIICLPTVCSLCSSQRIASITVLRPLKVKNDILINMNKQHVTLLVMLDLSAAFDTVDHCILLQRLRSSLGLQGKVLSWLSSYLSGRSQQILVNGTLSKSFDLECDVSQGSCLGPLLFTIYTSKLFEIIKGPLLRRR